jgi:hypothetical protein
MRTYSLNNAEKFCAFLLAVCVVRRGYRRTATATGAGLRARIVQCIMPTGGVCPNAKKNEPNQLSERDFPAPVR